MLKNTASRFGRWRNTLKKWIAIQAPKQFLEPDMQLDRSIVATIAVSVLVFSIPVYQAFNFVDQDAYIYFVFFKNFFSLPFSYQPSQVAHGATSPLQVLVFAPVFHLFGDYWLTVAKLVNYALVFFGVCLVHCASGVRFSLLPLSVAAIAMFSPLFLYTATMFETGLAFFLVALLINSWNRSNSVGVAFSAGLLHLARPELALVTICVVVALAWRTRRLNLGLWIAASVPITAFYIYMWASGAGVLPTSVVGRAILAIENNSSWYEKITSIVKTEYVWPYLVVVPTLVVAMVLRFTNSLICAAVIVPIVALYTVFPPGYSYYVPRYLIPIIPAFLMCFLIVSRAIVGKADPNIVSQASPVAAGIAALFTISVSPAKATPTYDYDTIFQKDLAEAVMGIVKPESRALMYEIQGQYYFPAHTVSADGIVGREAHKFLRGEEAFDSFVERENIDFIVTFDGFAYRPIYKGTPLVDLFRHDMTASVGDRITIGAHTYEKVVANPEANDPTLYSNLPAQDLNYGNTLRVFGPHKTVGAGQLIQWNSVYKKL
jgi:hypothetical protein